MRVAAALGVSVVTHAGNVSWYQKTFDTRNAIAPDMLARTGRKARFVGVDDLLVIDDGARRVELHAITGSAHSDAFLMVYLPKEKLLVEADAFTPGAQNASAPAAPNANHLNLVENIERLKLGVDRILPLHGRVAAIADLYIAAGKTPPR